ncbi:MAG: thioredoxin family protein [Verrucomicrobiia bacterium]
MKTPLLLSLLLLFISQPTLHPAEPPPSSPWLTSLPQALTLAKKQRKPLLLLFTGSDWCSWCRRLQNEVLSTPVFQNFARDHLILVEIDFPRLKPMPLEQHHANLMLADRFGIIGLPSLLLLNDQGEKLAEFGFPQGGPSSLITKIQTALPSTLPLNPPPPNSPSAQ